MPGIRDDMSLDPDGLRYSRIDEVDSALQQIRSTISDINKHVSQLLREPGREQEVAFLDVRISHLVAVLDSMPRIRLP